METLEKVARILAMRNWTLALVPEGVPDVIACDHPVVLESTIKRPDGLLGSIGYGMRHTALFFPLTRRSYLFGSFEDPAQVIEPSRFMVAYVNTAVINNSERQIYAYDQSFEYAWENDIRIGTHLFDDIRAQDHRSSQSRSRVGDPDGE